MTQQQLVVLAPEQITVLITNAVKAAVSELSTNSAKEVLTLEEASEFLGRHPKVLSKMVQRDGLPAHYISEREPRFLRSELLRWLSERATQPKQLEE